MNDQQKIIAPGASLGIFGGGQLGRMFAQAAQRLGYRVVVFSDQRDCPAAQVVGDTIVGDYLDPLAVRKFAEQVDVVTLEFENIAIEAVARAAEVTLVRPGVKVLAVAQDRINEKKTLQDLGFPVTPYREIRSLADLASAGQTLGWPLILKTTKWGYDGKGQRRVSDLIEAQQTFELLGPDPLIAEKWIPLRAEVSVIVARTPAGAMAVFPMFTNTHANHILDVTTCPASPELQAIGKQAETIALAVGECLELEGLLCVEFFVSLDGELMINEIAPRPHNSGHLTIEASRTSQFEQQVRAICNLPLGDTSLIQPAAMANLLGGDWENERPQFDRVLQSPSTYLHLYGKQDSRPGRKMGHITTLSSSAAQAAELVTTIRDSIRGPKSTLF